MQLQINKKTKCTLFVQYYVLSFFYTFIALFIEVNVINLRILSKQSNRRSTTKYTLIFVQYYVIRFFYTFIALFIEVNVIYIQNVCSYCLNKVVVDQQKTKYTLFVQYYIYGSSKVFFFFLMFISVIYRSYFYVLIHNRKK